MLLFSNVKKLYDGTSADASAVHHGVDLHVDEARGAILELRPHDPALRLGDAHTRVDGSDLVITPGLIDCHGHVTVLGLRDDDIARSNADENLLYVEKVLYRTLVSGGVTTLRDVGGATHKMKRLVDEGVLIGPRLAISIGMLSTTGGHADFRGPDRCHATLSKLWPPGPGRPSNIVDGPWDCRKRVREIAACGADLIKVCASPGVASPSDHLEHRDFTSAELRAICDEAGARGLKVAAHAHSRSGIELAIECGVSDLQHISFLDARLAEMAHKAGCTVTPTSWVMDELTRADGLTPFVMEKVKRVVESHRRAVEFAYRGGLEILAGGDAVIRGMHGRNYLELVHLTRDGLSPLSAWYGATGLAARHIGRPDVGTIAPGQRADLLICAGDVVADPEIFAARGSSAILEVFKDGVGYRGTIPGTPHRTFAMTVDSVLDAP
ncbi:MAG: amidohydrolase family protein [Myxococcales bacterium]|nr:amidohydrolase family protein [Myxococcales bacterium]